MQRGDRCYRRALNFGAATVNKRFCTAISNLSRRDDSNQGEDLD